MTSVAALAVTRRFVPTALATVHACQPGVKTENVFYRFVKIIAMIDIFEIM